MRTIKQSMANGILATLIFAGIAFAQGAQTEGVTSVVKDSTER